MGLTALAAILAWLHPPTVVAEVGLAPLRWLAVTVLLGPTVVLGVMVSELAGPLLTRSVLTRSGEAVGRGPGGGRR